VITCYNLIMSSSQLRTNLILAYNRQAQQRNQSTIQDWKAAERSQFLSLLRGEGKRSLLEVGAGHGRDSQFFQEHGFQVTCIDLSPQMVHLCQQKGLDARLMDMIDLEFADDSFDAVYALNSLLHVPKNELPTVLQNVHRVLRAEGLFYLGVYGGYDFEGIWEEDSYQPKRFFSFHSDAGLQQAVAPYFRLLSFRSIPLDYDILRFQSLTLRKSAAE
jgi:SAM-dependent methyltransferase